MLTVNGAATLMQVSPKAIYGLVKAGLPHYRIGGAIRIDEQELLRFCQQKREQVSPLPHRHRVQLKHLRLDP